MTAAKLKLDFKLTINTPYLAYMGELWCVSCGDFGDSVTTAPRRILIVSDDLVHIRQGYFIYIDKSGH